MRHATCGRTGFQLQTSLQNVQVCHFDYSTCDSVCNTIQSPCDETRTRRRGVEIQSLLCTLISDSQIRKRCSVNQTSINISNCQYQCHSLPGKNHLLWDLKLYSLPNLNQTDSIKYFNSLPACAMHITSETSSK